MTRIRIQDLPKDVKISRDEMGKVMGGVIMVPLPVPETPFRSKRETSYIFVPEFVSYK